MAIKYCGECDFFERDEENTKGWCSRIKRVVWDSDFIPDDDDSCYYYEEE